MQRVTSNNNILIKPYKITFNKNHLQLIAILAMTIDHFTCLFFPQLPHVWYVVLLHLIGRLTAPIMWFFIVEGYHYTHNLKKYISRMFIFALVSHFAYCFAFGIQFLPFSTGSIFNQTSVLWSLAFALVALSLNDKPFKGWIKILLILVICAVTFCSDWSSIAVMAILYMSLNRGNLKKQMLWMMIWVAVYAIVYFFAIDKLYGVLQLGVILVYPFLKRYNGEKGKWKGMRWFFYIYYPLHLAIIGLLRVLLYGWDFILLF